jgi:glycosyltransferase involved in cell wall biosynthesis
MPPLVDAFALAGVALELVMVDNGSTDGTSAAIDALVVGGLPITKATVPLNRGQGLGILTGLAVGRGAHIGYVNADGQIAPEDVVRVYTATRAAPRALVKARRLNRPDGITRALVSVVYNAMMQVFFWGMPSRDVNCNPKILPADVLRLMQLSSYDWFLEAEIMLKARHLGLTVVEIDVVSRERQGGRSHVRVATVLEFLRNIMLFRLGGPWRAWRKQVGAIVPSEAG